MTRYTEKLIEKGYEGANGLKECVEINGVKWMVKSHSRNISRLSEYTNSIYSEYVACHLYSFFDIDVQDTMLGEHKFSDGKVRESVYCKDIEFDTKMQLVSLKKIFNRFGNSLTSARILLTDMIDLLKKQTIIDSGLIIDWFYKVYAIDTLIANPDRHLGNIALLFDGSKYFLAPIFDCGSSLFPQMSEEIQDKIINGDEKEINMRVDTFMTSAYEEIFNDKERKINYKEYILRTGDIEILKYYKMLYDKFDEKFSLFCKWLDNDADVPDKLKKVYKIMINSRYQGIIREAVMKFLN